MLTAGLPASRLSAHAALTTCHTDPVVTLSNGAQVSMSHTIYDASTNVTEVTYTLHGPSVPPL